MRRVALVALLVLAACGDTARQDPQLSPRSRESRAQVVRSGFSIHDEQVGTGAIIRVSGDRGRREIPLRVTFFADGKRLGAERDRLPFCPPRTDCPWGQTLFGEHFGERWPSIDRVEVEVVGPGEPDRRRREIRELDVDADAKKVIVTPAGEEGAVYLVAFYGDTPRGGYSFFTRRGERDELRYSQRIFARANGDEVRAFLYPGAVPARVHGPAD